MAKLRWQRRSTEPVHSVTTAGESRTDDLSRRQVQYLIANGIRVICFFAAVAVPYGPFTWVLILLATVLPYVAVLLANTSSGQPKPGLVAPEHQRPSLSDQRTYRLGGHDSGHAA